MKAPKQEEDCTFVFLVVAFRFPQAGEMDAAGTTGTTLIKGREKWVCFLKQFNSFIGKVWRSLLGFSKFENGFRRNLNRRRGLNRDPEISERILYQYKRVGMIK